MALIKSISGIRGTIGGKVGENLTPIDIVECTAAFGYWLKTQGAPLKLVLGRDGRISGALVSQLVAQTLVGLGFEVIDLGLSTTPTVEMAVPEFGAGAGIIVTASHNPKQWNALKFLNAKGEFISEADGEALLKLLSEKRILFSEVDQLGTYRQEEGYLQRHFEHILALSDVNIDLVKSKKFKVVVDAVNSTGALSVPPLLTLLGCEVILINGEITGDFAHNPEPLPAHLTQLSEAVVREKADLGIAVDPDVDRLAFVNEDGNMFGEEYTLVAVADYMLSKTPGASVSNLSSTRALRDVTEKHGGKYYASAVGEVNVVEQMKAVNAVIGGEGNGGIIVPALHYGRDALAGIALFLSHLAQSGLSMSALRATYPNYEMVKDKIALDASIDLAKVLASLESSHKDDPYNTIDGLKIDFQDCWVHLRKSNTEPIIRIYAEGPTQAIAEHLVNSIKGEVDQILMN
ncbi:MAG: phosphoglucosamine mutase [Saprospiraceae bacterium]